MMKPNHSAAALVTAMAAAASLAPAPQVRVYRRPPETPEERASRERRKQKRKASKRARKRNR